jgi:peptide/nickel transport system ATP-binding protein
VLEGRVSLLELERVSKVFKVGAFGTKELRAVHDVSFDVQAGEVLSLIGESGSGKTTVGRLILRLSPVTSGTIRFEGTDVSRLRRRQLKAYYRQVQGVFQDPFSSFNPIFKVNHVFRMLREEHFAELSRAEWRDRTEASLAAVGLDAGVLRTYPHQLSGGQLQRILVARALLLDIKLLVADEIISMLDASTRVDVLNLLGELKTRGLAIVFITHDLSLGNYISDRTVILRRGAVVEMGATEKVFGNPRHEYTRSLLAAVPQLHRTWSEVEAELEAGACGHDVAATPIVEEPAGSEGAALVEVEPDHLVAQP